MNGKEKKGEFKQIKPYTLTSEQVRILDIKAANTVALSQLPKTPKFSQKIKVGGPSSDLTPDKTQHNF